MSVNVYFEILWDILGSASRVRELEIEREQKKFIITLKVNFLVAVNFLLSWARKKCFSSSPKRQKGKREANGKMNCRSWKYFSSTVYFFFRGESEWACLNLSLKWERLSSSSWWNIAWWTAGGYIGKLKACKTHRSLWSWLIDAWWWKIICRSSQMLFILRLFQMIII